MIRLILGIFIAMFIEGCTDNTKCIQVVNGFNKKLVNVKVEFSAVRERNNNSLGNLVTSFNPYYHVSLGRTDNQGKICIEENYKQSQYYLYTFMQWKFYNKNSERVFFNFKDIPKIIILSSEPKKQNKAPITNKMLN